MVDIKVSFVIPAYNVSQYIQQCVESILNQTLNEIEVIVINDGSTDGTLKILNSFNDCRLKVVSKQNEGPSAARNDGAEMALGKYIIFIDGDDFVDMDYAKKTYDVAIKFNADIVVTDMFKDSSGKLERISDFSTSDGVINKNEYLNRLIFSNGVCHNMVNKMIRAEILKKNQFPKGIFLGEDFDTIVRVVFYSSIVVKLNEAFYHYRIGENNTSAFESLKGIKDHKFVYNHVIDFCITHSIGDNAIKHLEFRKIKGVYLPVLLAKADPNNHNYIRGLKIVFEDIDCILRLKGFKKLRLKYRLLFYLLKYIGNTKKAYKLLFLFNTFNNFFSRRKIKDFKA
jgi:sugar transferase